MNIEGKDFIIGAVFVLVIVATVFLTWHYKPGFTEVRYTETKVIEKPVYVVVNTSSSSCTAINGEYVGDCEPWLVDANHQIIGGTNES